MQLQAVSSILVILVISAGLVELAELDPVDTSLTGLVSSAPTLYLGIIGFIEEFLKEQVANNSTNSDYYSAILGNLTAAIAQFNQTRNTS